MADAVPRLGVWEVVEVIQLSNYPAIQHGHGIPYFRLLWPCLEAYHLSHVMSCTLLAEDMEMLTLGGFNIPKAIVTVHSAGYLWDHPAAWRFQGWRWSSFKNCWFYPSMSTCWSNKRSLKQHHSASLPLFSAISGFWWYHKTLTPKGPGIIHWIKFQESLQLPETWGSALQPDVKVTVGSGMSQVNEIIFPRTCVTPCQRRVG